jgi:hypothetical protein
VLQTTRNLEGTKIRIEQDYGNKVSGMSRQLILYLKDARQQGNSIPSIRQVREKQKSV